MKGISRLPLLFWRLCILFVMIFASSFRFTFFCILERATVFGGFYAAFVLNKKYNKNKSREGRKEIKAKAGP